jgi:hypothetical protein
MAKNIKNLFYNILLSSSRNNVVNTELNRLWQAPTKYHSLDVNDKPTCLFHLVICGEEMKPLIPRGAADGIRLYC